jgi:hypothetical protein
LAYPPLLSIADEASARAYFEAIYCQGTIKTFDGLEVRFRKSDFPHCCYESSQRNDVKDTFSLLRAQRLHWIVLALQDPCSGRFVGWDNKTKSYDKTRRVTLVMGDFVVVIALTRPGQAIFITAYVADSPYTLAKIKSSPKWT